MPKVLMKISISMNSSALYVTFLTPISINLLEINNNDEKEGKTTILSFSSTESREIEKAR